MSGSSEEDGRRVAVVTGGSGAIGGAVVERLADDYEVFVLDAAEPKVGSPCTWCSIDLRDGAARDRLAQQFDRVSVLINLAGVMDRDRIDHLPVERILDLYETNVLAPYELAKAFVPGMRRQGFGRIVNVSSVMAGRGVSGYSAYASSKAALEAMTRVWAAELAPHGITVNTVAPGYVDAPMIGGLFQYLAKQQDRSPTDVQAELLRGVAIGRLLDPAEVAAVIGFLARPESSGVTGATWAVDGGARL